MEFAQSAAAKVTATSTAAVSIAAEKFKSFKKMVGNRTGDSNDGQKQSGASSQQPAATVDMLAMRTKDDRIINTLTTGLTSRPSRFE